MSLKSFEDLLVWQKARELTKFIYSLTLRQEIFRDFELRNQARRAATSIMLNISEGFERNGNKEFVQFLYIAKGSSGELRSLSYLLLDLGLVSNEEFLTLKNRSEEISRMITGLIKHLRLSEIKGPKFKVKT